MMLDLLPAPSAPATPIRLGLRTGRHSLLERLEKMSALGVAHVSFNLRPGNRPVEDVLAELAEEVLPYFPTPAGG